MKDKFKLLEFFFGLLLGICWGAVAMNIYDTLHQNNQIKSEQGATNGHRN